MGFAEGFSAGSQGVTRGLSLYNEGKELEMRKAREAQESELRQINIDAGRRTNQLNLESDAVNREMADLQTRGMLVPDASPPRAQPDLSFGPVDGYQGDPKGLGPAQKFAPFDPNNTEHRTRMEGLVARAAALKGDMAGVRQSWDAQRAIREEGIFGDAVKKFQTDPESAGDYMRWLNKNNPSLTVAPQYTGEGKSRKLTGYNITSVGPTGDASSHFVSPEQAATLAGATALMQVNPTKALGLIGGVNKDIAGVIAAQNQLVQNSTTGNNTATHYSNQDSIARQRLGIAAQAAERQAQMQRMGAAQQFVDKDGNIVIGVPTMGKGGLSYETIEMPKGLKPYNARAESGPAKEVPTEGQIMKAPGGQAYMADGLGGQMDVKGVVPSKRAEVLHKAGIGKELAETLTWHPSGKYVMYGQNGYDVSDPKDMAALKREMETDAVNDRVAGEIRAAGGFLPSAPRGARSFAEDVPANARNLGLMRERRMQAFGE